MRTGSLEGFVDRTWQVVHDYEVAQGDGAIASFYPVQADSAVKATDKYSTNYWPYFTTDPTKSLTGGASGNMWNSNTVSPNGVRFHVDLGMARIVTRVYYENGHTSGGETNYGVKAFTFWGTNNAAAFAELTYGTDANWTQLTCSVSQLDQHVAADQADPKYFTVTNTTAYRYYAMKCSTAYLESGGYYTIRRLELQGLGVTSYTISGLSGDTDVKYRLISRVVNGYNGSMACYLRPNNISSGYGYQYIMGQNSTVNAFRGADSGFGFAGMPTLGMVNLADQIIQAKSGTARTCITKQASGIIGTTVSDTWLIGSSLENTADNITSFAIVASQASGIGIGSRFILLKEVRIASGLRTGELDIRGTLKGAWQEVYRHTVAGAAETSITVSGLLGNTLDQILRVRVRAVNGYNGGQTIYIAPNADTGNAGYQYVMGLNTTPSASRGTGGIGLINTGALNDIGHSETLLYAKSGFVRTTLTEASQNIVTTTVGSIVLIGHSWNNTINEITSLVIAATQANGLGIGTEIVIERLNL